MSAQAKSTYVPERCQHEVAFYNSGWPNYAQCSFRHKPGSPFCKVHDPATIAARKKASDEREAKAWRARMLEAYGASFFEALKKIADGDNNPRETAREAIAYFTKKDAA